MKTFFRAILFSLIFSFCESFGFAQVDSLPLSKHSLWANLGVTRASILGANYEYQFYQTYPVSAYLGVGNGIFIDDENSYFLDFRFSLGLKRRIFGRHQFEIGGEFMVAPLVSQVTNEDAFLLGAHRYFPATFNLAYSYQPRHGGFSLKVFYHPYGFQPEDAVFKLKHQVGISIGKSYYPRMTAEEKMALDDMRRGRKAHRGNRQGINLNVEALGWSIPVGVVVEKIWPKKYGFLVGRLGLSLSPISVMWNFGAHKSFLETGLSGVLPLDGIFPASGWLGYRFQPLERGMVFRAGIALFSDNHDFIFMPGLSLGYAF